MKRKKLALCLGAAVCLLGGFPSFAADPAKATEVFDDVPESAWYAGAIQYVYENGIMKGMGDSPVTPGKLTFGSKKQITRGEFATLLYQMEGKPEVTGEAAFSDVPAKAYYAKPVQWLYENGIAKGVGNGAFAPNEPVTREQLARMLDAYAQYKHYDTTADEALLERFGDSKKISSWATSSLAWATGAGVMSGTGDEIPLLNPRGNASRAECASMVKKLCENVLSDEMIEITENAYDLLPLPDPYSVGPKGELTKVQPDSLISGIQLKKGAAAGVFKFATMNQDIQGRVVIENCDFSDFNVATYEEDQTDRDITIVFKNCRFAEFDKAFEDSRVFYEFENCSFVKFQGSNVSFKNCEFGGTYLDAMRAYRHVMVQDCYFHDFNHMHEGGEYHSDCVHIFGKANVDVKDLIFDHCRFDIPVNNPPESNSTINACFMLSLEYSNGSDITVQNCILNGGGYTIYAGVKKPEESGFTLSNVLFKDNIVGGAAAYGPLYPKVDSNVTIENLDSADSLNVGSVRKEEGSTHFCVSNLTTTERTLKIVTDAGTYTKTIFASPGGKILTTQKQVREFPTDLDISIPADCSYALCLDVTDPEDVKQVRFVNFGEEKVYLPASSLQAEAEQ